MSEDLSNELEAINSIYGDHTFQKAQNDGDGIYTLSLRQCDVTLRLSFPREYPETAPRILGIETIGDNVPKGRGNYVFITATHVLSRIFSPGQVCLFDLIQELDSVLDLESAREDCLSSNSHDSDGLIEDVTPAQPAFSPPTWTLSASLTEKKSLFIGRSCVVTSPAHVQSNIAHLLTTDKRCAKATHNISAYRIRSSASTNKVTYQDCDDDGESAAGGRLLHLLQVMDVWGVLVVVSRWYGGVHLGPDRFRCINAVAREAVVNGGCVKEVRK